MNTFFTTLKKYYPAGIKQEDFEKVLQDEEYINGNELKMCFFCNSESFDIISGGGDVYDYVGNRMQESISNIEECHHLGLLCNWLNFHGVPIFANREKFPNLKLLICKDCGQILGVYLDKWYFPYLGYVDTEEEIYPSKNFA